MQPSKRHNNFIITLLFKHKTQPKCSTSFLCCVLLTVHFPTGNLLHILNIYLFSNLHLPEGQSGTDRNLKNSQGFWSLFVTINAAPLTSYPLLFFFFPPVSLIQSQAILCDICAGKNGAGTRFCPSTPVLHCQYHYIITSFHHYLITQSSVSLNHAAPTVQKLGNWQRL
jgi:hypothetical protein